MKFVDYKIAAAVAALAAALQGCAVVPFIPLIASAPRVLLPGTQPGTQTVSTPPPAPDPVVAREIATGKPADGDTGATIPAQDRVTFSPDNSGSIPLRVASVDLIADLKARGVGDIITVKVAESVSGESKAGTDLANKRAINGALPNLFSAAESIAQHNPLLNLANLVNSSTDNSTSGQGDMTADDTFVTTISAVVTKVNPSGTLSIRGERQLKVNGENDTIHLSGAVRPEDIDSTDSVASTSIADLQLSITGQGLIRDKQGNGIGTRLFDWLWLF